MDHSWQIKIIEEATKPKPVIPKLDLLEPSNLGGPPPKPTLRQRLAAKLRSKADFGKWGSRAVGTGLGTFAGLVGTGEPAGAVAGAALGGAAGDLFSKRKIIGKAIKSRIKSRIASRKPQEDPSWVAGGDKPEEPKPVPRPENDALHKAFQGGTRLTLPADPKTTTAHGASLDPVQRQTAPRPDAPPGTRIDQFGRTVRKNDPLFSRFLSFMGGLGARDRTNPASYSHRGQRRMTVNPHGGTVPIEVRKDPRTGEPLPAIPLKHPIKTRAEIKRSARPFDPAAYYTDPNREPFISRARVPSHHNR